MDFVHIPSSTSQLCPERFIFRYTSSLTISSTPEIIQVVSNVSLKNMIRVFTVCAAFIPAFVLPAEALPTNTTKPEGDVRAASNYRTVRHSFTNGAKSSANILNSRLRTVSTRN